MKKLYTLGIALSMVAFGTQSFAQVNKTVNFAPEYPDAERTVATDNQLVKGSFDAKSTDVDVYWSEDFSNGFGGQDDNGAWSFDLVNGELWFQTFPAGEPNGYDPDEIITATLAYGELLSSYYGGTEVNSPTRLNGFMMIDASRWDNGGNEPAISALVSPMIDISGQGITHANLVFYQRLRMCCAGSGLVANAEVSVDGGVTWVPYDAFYPYGDTNDNIDREIRIDISETLQGALDAGGDLSMIKVRFLWAGAQTNYFWQVDDVSIQALEDNDLEAGKTWYNNHAKGVVEYNASLINGEEYLRTFENSRTPIYFARPLTFAMAVTNKGIETQTGVQLKIQAVAPDGSILDLPLTDAMDMPYGMTDTLNVAYTIPDVQEGLYRFGYEVIQNEADSRPLSNVGDTTVTRFTSESGPDGAIMQNSRNVNGGRYPFADNIIWSTAYTFPEVAPGNGPKAITHVEAVFMFTAGFAETVVGTTVYFNVRKGSLMDEDPDVPASLTTVEFGEDPLNYEGINIEKTLSEDDIWYTADGIAAYHYASFELPTPVLIEPNTVYQAEVRIPFGNAVYVPVSSPEESFGSLVYLFNYNSNAPGWYTLGDAGMPLRFKIDNAVGIEDITYETGVTLVQNFPNPFTDVTKIQYSLDKSDNVKLEVRDLTGKLVFQKDMGVAPAGMPQSYDLQRGSLAPGMYTYSIVTSEYQVSRKLTVQ